MKQGLWQCGQCRQWWIYKVEPHTTLLNRECLRCGKRVRATIDRRPGRRGRPATVRVEQRPSYTPHSALEHERQARNKHWRRRPAIDEFTRASKLEEWSLDERDLEREALLEARFQRMHKRELNE